MKHAKQITYGELAIGDKFLTTDIEREYKDGECIKKTITTIIDTVTDIKTSKTGRVTLITKINGRWNNGPVNPKNYLEI